mgnify:CR=1 FL=1
MPNKYFYILILLSLFSLSSYADKEKNFIQTSSGSIQGYVENKVVNFDFGSVGLSVCFDLNDKEYISRYECDVLVAPSNGWRLFPGYPFDSKIETPQIERAKENNFAIIRPYCAGWLGPLYFAGRSMIVDRMGNIVKKSKTRNQTELLISDIDI